MPNAFDNFVKQTQQHYGGTMGLGFAAGDIADIATSDNKLKAVLATILRIKFEGPMMALGLAQGFNTMRKSILALVHDTGSLDAALKKLAQIQGLQRVFAPMVGGLEAAKRKVAELVLFSAQNNLRLPQVGEASRSLQIYTRGAYSSTAALTTIGDAAAATGNSIDRTADAVGMFYSALRDGQPIEGVAENLRQMGLISQGTVDRLMLLQQSGAGVAQVMGTLTSALDEHKGGMQAAKSGIEAVSEAYEQAKKNLKEQLGMPFTESEISNTKNMTEAMNAIAPVVGRLSQFFATLTGGFSTLYSWIVKTAASSPGLTATLEALAEGIGVLVAGVSMLTGIGLGVWLIISAGAAASAATAFLGLSAASGILATAITALGIAIRIAMGGAGILLLIASIAPAIGLFNTFSNSAHQAADAVDRLKRSYEEAERAMQKQIDSADTLIAQHEAIAAAMDQVRKAQDELNDALKKGEHDQIEAALDHLDKAKDQFRQAAAKQSALPTSEESQAAQESVAREKAMAETKFQTEYDQASPERKAEMLRERSADRASRYQSAKAGLDARASYSRASQEADNTLAAAQGRHDIAKAEADRSRTATGQVDPILAAAEKRTMDDVVAAMQAKAHLDHNLPKDSSVYAEIQARKARESGDTQGAANWQNYAAQRKQEEANAGQFYTGAAEDKAAAAAMERENRLTQERAHTELEIAQLKSVGVQHAAEEYALRQRMIADEIIAEQAKASRDKAKLDQLHAQQAALERQHHEQMRGTALERDSVDRQLEAAKAMRENHPERAVNLQNLDAYAQHFEKMRELYGNTQEAKDKALALTNADIERNAPGAVASSLARIGGGGGVGDPLISIAEQQRKLQEDANQYHQRIAQATEKLAGGASNNSPVPYDGTN